jgi:FKBP-type peptidyl-prolyl cis-trans isomerase SlpA
VINTFADKPATLSLGTGQLAPAMERRLLGLTEGARTTFDLAAGEAFGERNPQMLQRVKRSLLAEMGDPTPSTTWATWCSSPRPTAAASYAGVVRE